MSANARRQVLLATCSAMPDGEEWAGTDLLLPALRQRGADPRWVVWDDPAVDWSAGLVAVRSTWDYETRRAEFLDWAGSVPWLLNSAAVFAWNTEKSYLPQLAGLGVPVVPTLVVEEEDRLPEALAQVAGEGAGDGVVKPCVAAGGRGLVVFRGGVPDEAAGLGAGPWVVQPLVDSVRTEGETSVFVLDGAAVSAARKQPASGEIRVHESYGGTTRAAPLTDEAADVARAAVAAAESLLGERLDYARVDQMRLADGALAVSELEATEPGLYLEVLPGNAAVFADLVHDRLRRG